ncbi:hypothetical protein FIBSPDRAFT_857814 [Athelia psychrophila]|uniref:Uncharacterized protein n=1 Tax=Athelia psychrophila TaxID=1759441 RepID=A0A166MI31_9AGAM|nr:hypothetical protein FIBSPDRAFT_857809 [Fibularhizoctonia sp. CBS 109695]KZP24024.1 hypothetical protein FIBSPDRAFT_857814 [Fibularhizoctonia sp. CBS 109695]
MRSFPVPPVNIRSLRRASASEVVWRSSREVFMSIRSVMDGAERLCRAWKCR